MDGQKLSPTLYEAIARAGLERASAMGASYADVRIVHEKTRILGVRLGRIGRIEQAETFGIGVRVLVGGAWGYAARPEVEEACASELAARAVEAARAGSPLRARPVDLTEEEPARGHWSSRWEEDPFEISMEEQFALLFEADEILRKNAAIRSTFCTMSFLREDQWLYTSEGTAVSQTALRSGAGITATAVGEGAVQTRSYPASFGGQYEQRGYELVRGFDLPGNAERVREEAVALLTAPPCPGGEFDVILGGSQLALQIHESVGHPNEFDRVLGFEADLAGRSFVTPEKRGSFRYGSPIVDLVADSTLDRGLATIGWDDDGVPARRWHVVEKGIHRNYLTNREFAKRLGDERSRGANRAWGWRYPPQIRIPNLSLMPGDAGTLEDLCEDMGEGFLLDTVKTWSIDQMRLNFQFTTEIGWKIERGKKAHLVRNPTYQGITPGFWASCDAICGPSEWIPWGVPNCGKGQPMQLAEMSHGCAPARFRGLTLMGG